MRRVAAFAGLLLAIAVRAPVVHAQHLPASASSTAMGAMPGMDHDAMPGMDMPATHADATPDPQETPAADQHAMHGSTPMQPPHQGARDPAMQHTSPSPTDVMPPHAMGPMQGGSPPPDARDPDYSDGVGMGSMHGIGMAMEDHPKLAFLRIDQLEAFRDAQGNGQQWEIEGGYGNNRDRLWMRSEGERSDGRLQEANVELLWQHAVAAFWDTQLGLRTDLGDGPDRHWAAFGIQGLAPYWFELEATGYVGATGRTAARLRAKYELLFTQRLVLQPELELNAYGKADPARGTGSGLSDASLGLRLRYEIRREVAPYVGLVWTRRFGGTADLARVRGETLFARQWVAGIRIVF